MPVAALCFDLDDTLLDTSGNAEAVRRTCETLARSLPGREVAQILAANQAAWASHIPEVEEAWTQGRLETSLIVMEIWRRTLRECGCDDEALVQLARQTYQELLADAHRLYDDVLGCFECLAPDVPVALITNGASDFQREKMRLLDIERRFKLIVVSGEHGIAKPDPAVFRTVLHAFEIEEPRRAWHIGDSLRADVGGAKAAGLTAVWLNRTGIRPAPHDPVPDHEIRSLAELQILLESA